MPPPWGASPRPYRNHRVRVCYSHPKPRSDRLPKRGCLSVSPRYLSCGHRRSGAYGFLACLLGSAERKCAALRHFPEVQPHPCEPLRGTIASLSKRSSLLTCRKWLRSEPPWLNRKSDLSQRSARRRGKQRPYREQRQGRPGVSGGRGGLIFFILSAFLPEAANRSVRERLMSRSLLPGPPNRQSNPSLR